ncbi:hypothetical protein FIBSPDRAFT_936808 [Athelia psychrophila]|uniref:Uncharacterized protein n=1 Tax=Athelia psychrophila TaxID=1759441 RepID=A0A166BIL1_9AGAM|nr:hypothetical protein FIBSPDRAFT_936808 [Fibularhizoctonia sp. CBS 109695]
MCALPVATANMNDIFSKPGIGRCLCHELSTDRARAIVSRERLGESREVETVAKRKEHEDGAYRKESKRKTHQNNRIAEVSERQNTNATHSRHFRLRGTGGWEASPLPNICQHTGAITALTGYK